MSRARIISENFSNSLVAEDKAKREILYSFDVENDVFLSKYAGMDIYQPTPENVESFIRRYVQTELSFFPRTVEVTMKIEPSNWDNSKKGFISDATGVVTLNFQGAKIELPFLIKNSELIPFDIIQMGDQKAFYTRENLAKVLHGIDKMSSNPDAFNPESAFESTEDPINPLTDPGFLGNTLRIQDQARIQSSPVEDRGAVIVASQIDDLLEKSAKFSPITEQDFSKIATILTEKYTEELVGEFEKIAEETKNLTDLENHAALALSNLRNMAWIDVNQCKSGDKIAFPEKDGGEISTTNAIVFKNITEAFIERKRDNSGDMCDHLFTREMPNTTLVVTEDGRFVFLKDRQKFYAIDKNIEPWSLKTVSGRDLKIGKTYLAIRGDRILKPFTVTEKDGYQPPKEALDSFLSILELEGIPMPFKHSISTFPDDHQWFALVEVSGANLEVMSPKQIRSSYINIHPALNNAALTNMIFWDALATDKDTKFVELKGTIKDYLTDPKQLLFTQSDGAIFKSASEETGQVTLAFKDKERDLFDLTVEWNSEGKKAFKKEKREFKMIRGSAVKGILRAAGMEYTQIITLIQRAMTETRVSVPLPPSATPDKINGGHVVGRVEKTINDIKNSAVAKNIALETLADVVGNQLGEVAVAYGPEAMRRLSFLARYADESEALAVKFEKLAAEYENDNMLKIAKLMVVQNRLENALIKVCEGEQIAFVKEACEDIVGLKDELEHIATELVLLKVAQYQSDKELVSPSVITSAVGALDRMYKIACGVTKEE